MGLEYGYFRAIRCELFILTSMARNKYIWLWVVSFFIMVLSSCKEEGPSFPDHTPKIETVVETKFGISKAEVNFTTPDSVSMTIQIYAKNVDWSITGLPDWITVVPMSGSGDSEVSIACSENKDITSRQGVFVVNGQYNNQHFPAISVGVTQPRCALQYATVDKNEYVFNGVPIDTLLKVNANTDMFQVEESDKLKEWCTVVADVNEKTISIKSVGINKGSIPNEGYFYLTTTDGSQTVKVTQKPLASTIYSPTVELPVKGGRTSIQIDGICLEMNTSNDWIESEISQENERTLLTIAVTKNYSVNDRNGYVYLTLLNGSLLEVPIHQACVIFDVSTSSLSLKANETDTVLQILTNVPWHFDDISADWVVVDPLSSDSAKSVSVKINNNNTLIERSTSISVYPDWLKDLRKTIAIEQEGVSYNVDSTTIVFSCESDTAELSVITNGDWTAYSADDWISLSQNSGTGNSIIEVRVADNKTLDKREGSVKISIAGNTETIKVRQEGIQLSVSPDITFTSRGGSMTLSVQTNTEWDITAQDEWINVSKNSMKGDGSFLVTASDYPSVNERNGSIVFSSQKSGKQFRFNVIQQARYLIVLADSVDFFAKGGNSDHITIETDGVVSVESQESWITVDKKSNEQFTVSASRNDTGLEREGKVKVSLTDLVTGSLEREVIITQAAPYFSVPMDSLHFSFEGGQSEFIIINTDGITEVSTDLEWITVTKESETQFIVTSSLYEGDNERKGVLHIALKDLGDQFSNDIVVVQDPPSLDVSVDSLFYYYRGGTSELVTFAANGEVLISSDDNWLTITQSNDTSFVVNATENVDDSIRTGLVSIRFKNTDVQSHKIIVTQEFDDPDKKYGSVDLGLSVLWADRNLCAETPGQNGKTYKMGSYYDDAAEQVSYGDKDLSYVVSYLMGTNWRLPTEKELQELIDNSNWSLSSLDSNEGYRVEGNGHSIFIPFNKYWSITDPHIYGQYYCLSVTNQGYILSTSNVVDPICVRGVRPYDYKDGDVVKKIYLDESSVELNLGDSYQFNPVFECGDNEKKVINAPYDCESDHEDKCVVDGRGHITALAPGISNLKFTSGSANQVYCSVRVSIPEIAVKQTTVSLAIGETCTLQVQANKCGDMVDAPYSWFEWSSENERIATVSSSGVVTALSHGFCNVIVKCGDAQTTCKIYVQEPAPVLEMVDMGLSVMWGSCNVGAVSYSDIGGLYAWGETATKEECDWSNYKWCQYNSNNGYSSTVFFTRYCTDSSIGFEDSKTVLEKDDDVAFVKLGDGWRMPTREEFQELIANCDIEYSSTTNIFTFTSKLSGNKIFLPNVYESYPQNGSSYYNSGYWTSSLNTENNRYAYAFNNSSYYNNYYGNYNYSGLLSYTNRYERKAVRPVYESNIIVPYTDLKIKHSILTLNIGDTITLSTTIKRGDYTLSVPVEWISTNESVATVGDNGWVSVLSMGSCKIVASFENLHDTCLVVVSNMLNGHEFVDLGLSVLWATCNIGASSPEESGDYYAWGETESKSDYSWSNYVYCNGSANTLTKYNNNIEFGTVVDNKVTLDAIDDVAYMTWGGNWRIPTREEYIELINKCTWTQTTMSGVNGYLVTSNMPGYTDNSIFLPAAGYRNGTNLINNTGWYGDFWSSSLYETSPNYAWELHFISDATNAYYRYCGVTVRPVYAWPNHEGIIDDLDDLFN